MARNDNLLFMLKPLAGRMTGTTVIMPRAYLWWKIRTNVMAAVTGVVLAIPATLIWFGMAYFGYDVDANPTLWLEIWFSLLGLIIVGSLVVIAIALIFQIAPTPGRLRKRRIGRERLAFQQLDYALLREKDTRIALDRAVRQEPVGPISDPIQRRKNSDRMAHYVEQERTCRDRARLERAKYERRYGPIEPSTSSDRAAQ